MHYNEKRIMMDIYINADLEVVTLKYYLFPMTILSQRVSVASQQEKKKY